MRIILLIFLFFSSCSKEKDTVKTIHENPNQQNEKIKKDKKNTRIDSIKQARKEIFAKVQAPKGIYKRKKISKIAKAKIITSYGIMEFELFPNYAPIAVENFVNLAKAGFYKNNQFFRVIEGFVIQTGDPSNTGTGTAGYYFQSEANTELSHDRVGMLSYANFDKSTNSSQFFITLSAQNHLDANHPLFGKIINGVDVLKKIGSVDTGENDKPIKAINILDIQITGL